MNELTASEAAKRTVTAQRTRIMEEISKNSDFGRFSLRVYPGEILFDAINQESEWLNSLGYEIHRYQGKGLDHNLIDISWKKEEKK